MARKLPLGIAVAFGATLIAPAAPALAAPAPAFSLVASTDTDAPCTSDLTQTELGALLERVTAATVAKSVGGLRYVFDATDDGADSDLNDDDATDDSDRNDDGRTLVAVRDGVNKRLDITRTEGSHSYRERYLENGHHYWQLSNRHSEDKHGLGVLHRATVWLNLGTESVDDGLARVVGFGDVKVGGTCAAGESGFTITFTEDGQTSTVLVDDSYALISATGTEDGQQIGSITATYAPQTVNYLPAKSRITAGRWKHAETSAEKRQNLRSHAKKIAQNAKAIAEKAGHKVNARDVQKAAKALGLTGTTRHTITSGVTVTSKVKDPYTHKTLRVTVKSVKHVVKISDNW
jgi:hypothetical protein